MLRFDLPVYECLEEDADGERDCIPNLGLG